MSLTPAVLRSPILAPMADAPIAPLDISAARQRFCGWALFAVSASLVVAVALVGAAGFATAASDLAPLAFKADPVRAVAGVNYIAIVSNDGAKHTTTALRPSAN